jgi:hypothetical protein
MSSAFTSLSCLCRVSARFYFYELRWNSTGKNEARYLKVLVFVAKVTHAKVSSATCRDADLDWNIETWDGNGMGIGNGTWDMERKRRERVGDLKYT